MDMDRKNILYTMYLSRFFEEKLQEEFSLSHLYGTTHLSIGQEASHTGLVAAIEDGDWIVPTHRCHGFNIARGSDLSAMFSEMLGSRHGLCKGLGGSMHMTDTPHWNLGSSAVVGSGVPLAGGCAFALKRQKKDNIAVAIMGDGATNRGSVHEMMNLASVWNLPLLFYVENNHYGMSAPSERMISTSEIHSRAEGYSMAHSKCDGNDVEAVEESVRKARSYILESGRPYMLEVETYRQCGHSKSDKLLYRTRSEEEKWNGRDPIAIFSSRLLERNEITEEEMLSLRDDARKRVMDAWNEAWEKKDEILSMDEVSSLVIPPSPGVDYSEGRSTHRGTYREAVREALDEIFSSDEKSFLMGEDIGVYGGCFGVTGELWKRHSDRLYETPVSEEAFTGLACGAAMLGERPIVEIMYADFMTLASDAVINHGAKAYFMSAGSLRCPMVVRTPMGGGTGHGAQHTACPESMFLNTPGLKVCAPSSPWSAKALLKAAVKEECPVVFFEHKALYSDEGEIGDENAILPLGKALVYDEGRDALVIGYSRGFCEARKALAGVKGVFMDLATIKPLDEEEIRTWAGRIGRILIVENVPLQGSVAETITRIIAEAGIQARIKIVSALDMPLAFSKRLEREALPSKERIVVAYNELMEERE